MTAKNNVILICEQCHCEIHPWLSSSKSVTYADFELARAKQEMTLLLEQAAKGAFTSCELAEAKAAEFIRCVFNTLAI